MRTNFYDIESLLNAFTLANWDPDENNIDLYILLDNPELMAVDGFEQALLKGIYDANENVKRMKSTIRLFDLHTKEANERLFSTIGLSDATMMNSSKMQKFSKFPDMFRITCDTDTDYDEETMAYFMGYNSDNYDLTMLAVYATEIFGDTQPNVPNAKYAFLQPTTAKIMRGHNDRIFKKYKKCMTDYLRMELGSDGNWYDGGWKTQKRRIWKNFKYSGRHIDVAKLNEKQQRVGLKRMIGMMGGQIHESDKLDQNDPVIHTTEELIDLIAYNISDVVNLDLFLFRNEAYKSQFILKRSLLKTYPELVYDKDGNNYRPKIDPENVRYDRLYIDSSSAQLTTKSLCPYEHLTDIPVVSFMYPAEEKAKELGIPRVNVLEEARKFFYSKFPQPELREQFDRIYDYYKQIEGKNFNESDNYIADFNGKPEYVMPTSISSIRKGDTTLCYFRPDGSPTSCFVNFSIGGVHGAEYNKDLYEAHLAEWERQNELLEAAKAICPDPVELRKRKKIEIDGVSYSYGTFLKTGATMTHAEWKDLSSKRPQLFPEKASGADGTELAGKYQYTSADKCEHEDFTSYYPNMLRMMMAFYNKGLGYDRYAEIFDNKEYYGFLMKPKNAHLSEENAKKPAYVKLRRQTGLPFDEYEISDTERKYFADMRTGTKLLLNSASGAADANFESPIRMNNRIISMRIIGQLFTWRIGQAQAYEGARIISTNTDGLYSVMERDGYTYEENRDFNNRILEHEAANIGVAIEPETMYLISKDTNNRMEVDETGTIVENANGGSLACFHGPLPSKSLAHPAIIDWALTEYLLYMATDPFEKGYSIDQPFNEAVGRNILLAAPEFEVKGKKIFSGWRLLQMYQNIIASSEGSMTFVFGTRHGKPNEPIFMQHYNRAFYVKENADDTMHLHAAVGRVITEAQRTKRKKDNLPIQQNDPIAIRVMQEGEGIRDVLDQLGPNKEASIKKITDVGEDWPVIINNDDLTLYSDEQIQALMDRIDIEKYLELIKGKFEESWRNITPEWERAQAEEKARIKEEEKAAKAAKAKKTAKTKLEAMVAEDDLEKAKQKAEKKTAKAEKALQKAKAAESEVAAAKSRLDEIRKDMEQPETTSKDAAKTTEPDVPLTEESTDAPANGNTEINGKSTPDSFPMPAPIDPTDEIRRAMLDDASMKLKRLMADMATIPGDQAGIQKIIAMLEKAGSLMQKEGQ